MKKYKVNENEIFIKGGTAGLSRLYSMGYGERFHLVCSPVSPTNRRLQARLQVDKKWGFLSDTAL